MKKRKNGVEEGNGGDSPSRLIDARIKELGGWRALDAPHRRKAARIAADRVLRTPRRVKAGWPGFSVIESGAMISNFCFSYCR